MDEIIIKRAKYPCSLGVTEEERSLKQIISMDISIEYELKKAGLSDSIGDTIDYSLINKQIRELLESKSFCLIEKIGEEVAQHIINEYKTRKVTILVRKLYALKNADCAAIEIVREKID